MMKKALGQTVRELKREVNKKVLKVPGIEQKVLDATSNEPWGPHGLLLADIAMATRNSYEYQTVMTVIWKRINDTGKNWRHVYKALTVLEYLVAHGSERVIDEIREHAYQILTLSDFRYIDSSGRDQGINVRKKSQNLVALVNDKERIIEARQKAAANRDKFRNSFMGGMHRPGSGGYDGRYDYDRYGSKNDDQYGYVRDREFGYREDERYGRYGYSKSHVGDHYVRDYEPCYSVDGYMDDEYRGRNASIDDYQYGSRSRSFNRHHAFDEDCVPSRDRHARAGYCSPDGRPLKRKFSEQNIGAPPSYEDAVNETRSPVQNERDGETSVATAPNVLPPASNNDSLEASDFGNSASPRNQKEEAFDSFNPRSSFSATTTAPAPTAAPVATPALPTTAPVATPAVPTAAPTASTSAEVDLIEALSDSFALVPTNPETLAAATNAHVKSETFDSNQPAYNVQNQDFDEPFGDGPFKAVSSPDAAPAPQRSVTSMPTTSQNANTFNVPNVSGVQHPSTNSQFLHQELPTPTQESDILLNIVPPSGPADIVTSHAASFSASMSQSAPSVVTYGQLAQPGIYCQQAQSGANMYNQPTQPSANPYGQPTKPSINPYGHSRQASSNAYGQSTQPSVNPYSELAHLGANPFGQPAHPNANPYAQPMQPGSKITYGNFNSQATSMATQISGSAEQSSNGSCISQNQLNVGNFLSPLGSVVSVSSLSAQQTKNAGSSFSQGSHTSMAPQTTLSSTTGALAIVPQPSKDKLEPKSAVWADTLSRGLINLNISGSKTNPLDDIGVDFDAINRKEKRMEKHAPTAVTSTVPMGQAMGSGSGIGRSGASILRPPVNPMVGSSMSMGMGMGGYGSMNQQPVGMNLGMGMNNMAMNPGMRINIGMSQGAPHMPPPTGMPGNYNPMMGLGGYSRQL